MARLMVSVPMEKGKTMTNEKYISVADARLCAESMLPDPFLRLAVFAVLEQTPAAQVEPVKPVTGDETRD